MAKRGRSNGACTTIMSAPSDCSCETWTDLVEDSAIVRGDVVSVQEETLLYWCNCQSEPLQ